MERAEKTLNHFMGSRSFTPAYGYSLLLWIMASLPGGELQRMQSYPESPLLRIILSDPFMHFVSFGLLALLIFRGFYRESRGSIPLASVAGLAIGYGFLIEVYQGILPWRTFGLGDLVWNTLGILFVLALMAVSKTGKMGSSR